MLIQSACVLSYTENAAVERDGRALIKLLEADGWFRIGVTFSPPFQTPNKAGQGYNSASA
jgi:hypothetical protein